jgi:hypothetical protein
VYGAVSANCLYIVVADVVKAYAPVAVVKVVGVPVPPVFVVPVYATAAIVLLAAAPVI